MKAEQNPYPWFDKWYADAERSGEEEPSTMTLATATKSGVPTARIVLYRGRKEEGFCFYTNYESKKGQELAENPLAALVFHWFKTGRQVRIEGMVQPLDGVDSDIYFRSRPRGSQLGAWASAQSRELSHRQELMDAYTQIEKKFTEVSEVPRPPNWGGYQVIPQRFEFWQSDENRLHWRWKLKRPIDPAQSHWKVTLISP